MKRKEQEEERLRGMHLIILVVLTIADAAVCLASVLLQWDESWMLPLLIAGIAACWYLHIGGKLLPAQRLWVFAATGWACILFNGVHASSVFDISVLAALEMLVYSQTEDRRLLHVSLIFYVFCLAWQIRLALTGQSVIMDSLVVVQLVSHASFLFVIYLISLAMMAKRDADTVVDESEINALRTAQRRTEEFLAGISHELRTPVNTVMGVAGVAIRQGADATEKEHARQVLEAGRRLTKRVDDMLDYMEIETGELTVTEGPYVLSMLLNDVTADLRLYEREDLPEILLDVDAQTPARLYGAETQIKKILRQGIENAIKFTGAGGIHVRVYPERHKDALNLSIDIQDTGIGMTRYELERIRGTAYQANSDRARRAGGLGLGFPIINGFVRKLHGFTNITSVPGEGTKVHISIPQKAEEDVPCMRVIHPDRLRIAFYQDPDKFAVPVVRDFYAQMIYHAIRDFRLTMQRVTTVEDLRRLLAQGDFTHLFTADEEYSRDSAYFDALAGVMHVIVVAKKTFRPSAGSQVTVLKKPLYTFPLVMVLNAETPGEARRLLNRHMETSFEGMRALVVDDEEMNLAVTKDMLAEYGITVRTALSGEEAVRLVRNETYDVIFMDHLMPGMDGVTAMHRIREIQRDRNRKSELIALTANVISGARKMFLEEGFDGYVAKPVDSRELERTLKHIQKIKKRT